MATDLFVYGTLADPDQVAWLLSDVEFLGPAVVEGLRHVDGDYPTLAPGGSAEGRLLRLCELDRLDAYEGVDRGLYVRVSVPHVDGGTVECYVGDPDRLNAPATWPGTGSFAERVRTYVESNRVRVRDR